MISHASSSVSDAEFHIICTQESGSFPSCPVRCIFHPACQIFVNCCWWHLDL
uniref:Uncharacterized protein n=1 Tax=Arundo donax TaxID=35708 RepID=A0A0A8Y3N9_ARUDO